MAQPVWRIYNPNPGIHQTPRNWCHWPTHCSRLYWIHLFIVCATMRWKGLWWNYGAKKWFYTQSELLRDHVIVQHCPIELYMNWLNGKNILLGMRMLNFLIPPGWETYTGSLSVKYCSHFLKRYTSYNSSWCNNVFIHFSRSLLEYHY
jgi:hypothetical protein